MKFITILGLLAYLLALPHITVSRASSISVQNTSKFVQRFDKTVFSAKSLVLTVISRSLIVVTGSQ